MSAEQNKERSRRMLQETMQFGNLDVYDELVAPDFVSQPLNITGREHLKQMARMVRTAFPDLTVTIGEQIAEGDIVATQFTFGGTHEGVLAMGDVAPTGKPVSFSGLALHYYKDGWIVKGFGVIDLYTLMQQVGVLPAAR